MSVASRFEQAFSYASVVHAGQVRKGTSIPYISHLLGVASIALEHGADEDEAIAALLHDAVEDAGGRGRLQDIRARFGDRVATIVEGCTDADVMPKPEWRPRKERYVAHLIQADAGTLLVSASDKLHNAISIRRDLHSMGFGLWDRFRGGREGSIWYYRACLEAFREAPLGDERLTILLDDLERTTVEIEQLSETACL
jgi:GTP pyrophosphokinase